jgi:RpiR family carbohydrate utilization transcriptional regulator
MAGGIFMITKENLQIRSATAVKIVSLYDYLSETEKKICDYIIANQKDIIHLSITEVADNTESSESTVLRTCRKLGFGGFQDFKITLAQELVSTKDTIFEESNENDTCLVILDKEIERISSTLEFMRKVISAEELEAAAEAIIRAKRIVVFGLGNSASVALDMAHKFTRLGFNIVASTDIHIQIMLGCSLQPGDVAVGISHSGSSRDIVEALENAKKHGATTICVTNYGRSPITKVSDIKLFTASEEIKHRILALTSRIAQLAIIDAIYIYISFKDSERFVGQMKDIEKSLECKKY